MTQDETEHGRTDELPDDRPLPGDGTYPAVEGGTDGPPPPEDRPMPGDGAREPDTDESEDAKSEDAKSEDTTSEDTTSEESAGDGDGDDDAARNGDGDDSPAGPDAEPVYNDRDKLDFDPDEGFYTGTAVTGDTEIPGEHERVDDVPVEEDGDDAKDSDDSDDAKDSDDSDDAKDSDDSDESA